jgi:hypothetical protein
MITDIIDFLPAYSNINNYNQKFLNPYDNFYESIFNKKEFNELKLDKIEFSTNKKNPLKHQKIIARFLSSHTTYDRLLLLHSMGTGKSFAAINAIEKIKKENSNFTGAIFFAKGKGLIDNFKNEIFEHTSDYIPQNYNKLSPGEKITRKNKLYKQYYSDYTFFQFAKLIKSMDKDEIKNQFSNKIIVIDEVHNIRLKEEKKTKTKEGGVIKETIYVYKEFYKFLHSVENCKILLMSGTPIKDKIDEFANIINLIIPEEEKLSTGKNFINNYFNFDKNIDQEDRIYTLKKLKKIKLKNLLKGRVSYLKAITSLVKKEFIGTTNVGNLKHFIVNKDYMSKKQSDEYMKIYENETKKNESNSDKKESGLYSKSRQASLFIFPDGTTGSKGFSNYITKIENKKFNKKRDLVKSGFTYSLGKDLKNFLLSDGEDHESILKNIKKCSSKYARTIENILRAKEEGKSSFVYCEYVKGSGSILFSLLLNLFGFSSATGEEGNKNSDKKSRYGLINNISSSNNKIKLLRDRFNRSDNLHGEFINVIIGSRVVSEGFSFKNVQEEHILTPHWNYSETDQAIARGYRYGSHTDLINSGITPTLKIFQYVSIPIEKTGPKTVKPLFKYSVDLLMYKRSETKDINIKHIERIIKESAFDCALNYERNFIEGYDGERECDYTSCYYNCDDIPSDLYKESIEEESTSSEEKEFEDESDVDEDLEEEPETEKETDEESESESSEESESESSEESESEKNERDKSEELSEIETEKENDKEIKILPESKMNITNPELEKRRKYYLDSLNNKMKRIYQSSVPYKPFNNIIDPKEFKKYILTLKYIPPTNERIDRRVEELSKYIDISPKMILDLGGGDGKIVSGLSKKYGSKAIVKEYMIPINKEPGVEYFTDLKEVSNYKYDLILALVSLHHMSFVNIANPIFSFIKPGGRVIIREHDFDNSDEMKNYLQALHYLYPDVEEENQELVNLMSRKTLIRLMETIDFKLIKTDYQKNNNPQALYYAVFEKNKDKEDFGDSKTIELDYSTYQLYYNEQELNNMIKEVRNLFKNYFEINLETIIHYFSQYKVFEVITCLRNIINENKIIYNKFGFPNYLREDNNIYFLVDNITIESNYFSEYYTKNPIIVINESFNDILDDMYLKNIPNIIKYIFSLTDYLKIQTEINKLPLNIIEIILEYCIISNIRNIEYSRFQRDTILNIFRPFFRLIEGMDIWISWLSYSKDKTLRCLELEHIDEGWKNCSDDYLDIYKNIKKEEKEQKKINPYNYYGIINNSLPDKFCIYDIKADEEKKKKNKESEKKKSVKKKKGDDDSDKESESKEEKEKFSEKQKGQNCGEGAMNTPKLYQIILCELNIPIPDDDGIKYFNEDDNKKHLKLLKEIKSNNKEPFLKKVETKLHKYKNDKYKCFKDQNFEDLSISELKRYYYFVSLSAKINCKVIRGWFEQEEKRTGIKLIFANNTCGQQSGSRKEDEE